MEIKHTTDFSLVGLAKYLNEKIGVKKSGKSFNIADIQQYIKRGHLPQYLGGMKIQTMKVIGKTVLRIKDISNLSKVVDNG